MKVTVSFYMEEKLKEILEKESKQMGWSLSKYVELVLQLQRDPKKLIESLSKGANTDNLFL